jgi:hypothetical protein
MGASPRRIARREPIDGRLPRRSLPRCDIGAVTTGPDYRAMRRSATRIYVARRTALINRLRSDGLGDQAAEDWVTAWEGEAAAADRDSAAFWEAGGRWIAEQRARRAARR